jgi:hypothetical protein
MDCLNSFTVQINAKKTFNAAGSNVSMWGSAGNYHWVVVNLSELSRYNIQGFKRIDLYGIEMVGLVQSDRTVGSKVIVQDYDFTVGIDAQVPLVSGLISTAPNDYNISDQVSNFILGKFANKVTFETPYSGLKNVTFNAFRAQGNNGETLDSVILDLVLQFVFYYKYEGE